MKKETKASLIIFLVVFLVACIMVSFIPDEVLSYTARETAFSFLGDMTVALIGMRGILAFTFALIATLLIKIVDTEEKKKAKPEAKKTVKKETKKTK